MHANNIDGGVLTPAPPTPARSRYERMVKQRQSRDDKRNDALEDFSWLFPDVGGDEW
jgi:hypothetical protein